MKFFEIPGQIDLMTTMTLSQVIASDITNDINSTERVVFRETGTAIATCFCNPVLHLKENHKFFVTPTIMTIGEDNIEDGIYCYASTEAITELPDMEEPFSGISFYGSFDLSKPKVVIKYNGEIIYHIDVIVDGVQVTPHVERKEVEGVPVEIYDIINQGILDGISAINLAKIAGYKQGLEAAAEMNDSLKDTDTTEDTEEKE